MGRSDWDEIRLVVKWSESGWWEHCGRLVYQHLDHNTPGKCSHSNQGLFLAFLSSLHIFPWLISSVISHFFSHVLFFSDSQIFVIYHWPWSLCWALKLYPQLLLDNPSQSTIDTSHSTNIIWTYHSPLATPKETSWWVTLPSTQFPKALIWESRITPFCTPPTHPPNNHELLLESPMRIFPMINLLS